MLSRMDINGCDINGVLYICPHTHIYVFSSCSYVSVLILVYMCRHTPHQRRTHASMYVSSSSYPYICVVILLFKCPHTPVYVSSYSYICVLILLFLVSFILQYMCPHTRIYMRQVPYLYICAYCYIYRFRILLNMHTTGGDTHTHTHTHTLQRCRRSYICVSLYSCICVLILQHI